MAAKLPSHPDLTYLKHQAKRLLRAHREGRSDACSVLRHLHRFSDKNDSQILAAPVALHEAQYALAMEYGFSSWPALLAHVKSQPKSRPAQPGESLVNPTSLWATIDAINEAFVAGKRLTRAQRQETATFIAERQGKPGSYGRMFSPVGDELAKGLRVFTGERIASSAGSRHILGHEACRALYLLDVQTASVREALDRASVWILNELPRHLLKADGVKAIARYPGIFCCPTCSCSVWRHLLVRREPLAAAGVDVILKMLRTYRNGQGAWRVWPQRYTLLALSETRTPAAVEEMEYAAKGCEQELTRRLSKTSIHSQRWRVVLERVLALV